MRVRRPPSDASTSQQASLYLSRDRSDSGSAGLSDTTEPAPAVWWSSCQFYIRPAKKGVPVPFQVVAEMSETIERIIREARIQQALSPNLSSRHPRLSHQETLFHVRSARRCSNSTPLSIASTGRAPLPHRKLDSVHTGFPVGAGLGPDRVLRVSARVRILTVATTKKVLDRSFDVPIGFCRTPRRCPHRSDWRGSERQETFKTLAKVRSTLAIAQRGRKGATK